MSRRLTLGSGAALLLVFLASCGGSIRRAAAPPSWTRCQAEAVVRSLPVVPRVRRSRAPDVLGPEGGLTLAERQIGMRLRSRVVRLVTRRQASADKRVAALTRLTPSNDDKLANQTANGLLVGPSRIVTAAHAVARGPLLAELDQRYHPTRIVAIDHDLDLALLSVTDGRLRTGVAPFRTVAELARVQGLATVWSRMRLAQYERFFPVVNRAVLLGGAAARWRDITSLRPASATHTAYRVCGGALVRGRSGSPVFDTRGRLVGIAVATGGAASNVEGALIAQVPKPWLNETP